MTTKSPRTLRRSKRIRSKHNVMMTMLGPNQTELSKEIVSTVELSQHGARVRGRKVLKPGSAGVLVELRTLRKAPFQVAWQSKAGEKDYLDSGLEFTSNFDFWTEEFPDAGTNAAAAAEKMTPHELLREALKIADTPSQESEQFWEGVWCGLVEQLEERKVITRAELVTHLRRIGELKDADSK